MPQYLPVNQVNLDATTATQNTISGIQAYDSAVSINDPNTGASDALASGIGLLTLAIQNVGGRVAKIEPGWGSGL